MSDAAKITFTRSQPAEPSGFTPPFVWHWEVSYQDQTFDDGGTEFSNLDAASGAATRKYWALGLESRDADKTVKAIAAREAEQRKRREAEVKKAQEKAAAVAAARVNRAPHRSTGPSGPVEKTTVPSGTVEKRKGKATAPTRRKK